VSDQRPPKKPQVPPAELKVPLQTPPATTFSIVDPSLLGIVRGHDIVGSAHRILGYGLESQTIKLSDLTVSSAGTILSGFPTIRSTKEDELAEELSRLRKQLADQTKLVISAQKEKGDVEEALKKARKSEDELQAKERLAFVLNRIHPESRPILLESSNLQRLFLDSTTCDAFVMSIDIRRSTDLMLKARRPELFATFIAVLCANLRDIVLSHNGVFDKFTGDGILAFFPDFYSGAEAGYSVVAAADAAHALFKEHYDANRKCFFSIIKDVGLGIGIDYGTVNLVQVGDGLTVVGTPVVYACRMGAAPAGITFLNQPAHEKIFDSYSAFCTFRETDLLIKHEGAHLAYEVKLNGKAYSLPPPAWRSFTSSVPAMPK
jgi:class 3 adenylate cyclase